MWGVVVSEGVDRIVLLWRHLGPYHVARARGAAELLGRLGIETVVVELCGAEESRDWELREGELPFRTVTVRPEELLGSGTAEMSAEVLELLEELRPVWVAVAGYDRPEMRKALGWAMRKGAWSILMSETKCDDRARPWWKRWVASRFVRGVDAGLVSGGASGEWLVSLGMRRERVFRQYGCVDNAFFAERAARCTREASSPFFVASCRLIEARKNLKGLLASYASYRDILGEDAWELVVCGDGEDREEIVGFARERGIEGVRFVGFQQSEELARYYGEASCFVHAAVNEAWGLVVNEAMAAGLPVLVSRRCGCAWDLVHEGVNGWTFDPHDAGELTGRMMEVSQLSEEARERMGRASQGIVGRFGCEAFAEGLLGAMCCGDERLRERLSSVEFRNPKHETQDRFEIRSSDVQKVHD